MLSRRPLTSLGRQTRATYLRGSGRTAAAGTAVGRTLWCRRWVSDPAHQSSALSIYGVHALNTPCVLQSVFSPGLLHLSPDLCSCFRATTWGPQRLASHPARSERCHALRAVPLAVAMLLPLLVGRHPQPRLLMGPLVVAAAVQDLRGGRLLVRRAAPPCSSLAPEPLMWMPLNLTCWGYFRCDMEPLRTLFPPYCSSPVSILYRHADMLCIYNLFPVRQVPGVDRWGIEETPLLDPVAKALRDASIRAQADPAGMPLAAVQRYEVLTAAADLMTPSARLAHEAGLLGRHHTETLLPTMLKQVRGEQATP